MLKAQGFQVRKFRKFDKGDSAKVKYFETVLSTQVQMDNLKNMYAKCFQVLFGQKVLNHLALLTVVKK